MVVRIGTNNTRASFQMVLCFDLQSALICRWENAMLTVKMKELMHRHYKPLILCAYGDLVKRFWRFPMRKTIALKTCFEKMPSPAILFCVTDWIPNLCNPQMCKMM